jgi:hypothetical protein
MMLVLSVATPAYALHVSDRLVSKAGRPHDPLANKSVILRARDGLLAVGYTGAAFVGNVPTDTWIAEILCGGWRGGQTGALGYGDFPVRDIGSSLRLLCQRARTTPVLRRVGIEIAAVGWQWNAKRSPSLMRNVLWVLHAGSGKLQWQQSVPRHSPERKTTFRMVATGDWALAAEDWRVLLEQVGAAGHDHESVERLLVEAIRRASELRPGTIGRDCMTVLLRPWQFPQARVRFDPDATHHDVVFGEAVEVAYSPWMIAPDAIHRPAILIGGLSCEQGLLTYSMEAPPAPTDQRFQGAFQAQVRPRF